MAPTGNHTRRKRNRINTVEKGDKDNKKTEDVVKSKYFRNLSDKCSTKKCNDQLSNVNEDLVISNKICKKKLTLRDFQKDGITLSKYLLGKVICRHDGENGLLCGRIVETEAYLGVVDKACHTFGEKHTDRVKPMYMIEGTSYVYSIYGMYYCLNISSSDHGGCVLIRALEPITGFKMMAKYREKNRNKDHTKSPRKPLKSTELCNGPSKLCQALNITKDSLNMVDMVTNDKFHVTDDEDFLVNEEDIVSCKRIGIKGYGEESANKPYRFYLLHNRNVSVIDKKAEAHLCPAL